MSKRASTMPPAPKPPTSLASSITIAETASLTGTKRITIRDATVIHPRSKLISVYGPVTIGSGCIISERCQVGLQSSSSTQSEGVVLGDHVVLEVGAVVEAKSVGEGSLIEINARVGKGAVLGKFCRIAPLCVVEENEVLPDYTVVYGPGQRRIDKTEVDDLKIKLVKKQVDVLRKLIPSNISKFQ